MPIDPLGYVLRLPLEKYVGQGEKYRWQHQDNP